MATALTSAHGGLEEAVSMLGWHRVCLVPSVILINDVIKNGFLLQYDFQCFSFQSVCTNSHFSSHSFFYIYMFFEFKQLKR